MRAFELLKVSSDDTILNIYDSELLLIAICDGTPIPKVIMTAEIDKIYPPFQGRINVILKEKREDLI